MAMRTRWGLLAASVTAFAAALCLAGCEAVLSLGDLKDEPADATAGEGSSPGPADGTVDGTGAMGDGAGSGQDATQDAEGATEASRESGGDGPAEARPSDANGEASDGSSDTGSGEAGSGDAGSGDAGGDATLDGASGDSSSDSSSGEGSVDAEAGPTGPLSCAPGGLGLNNCGAGGSGNESCCTSLPVTGGSFQRTYASDPDSGVATGLADPATVSNFQLDKYEITVGRFRQFVTAFVAGWRPAANSGKHTHLNGGQGLLIEGTTGTYETGWNSTWNGSMAPAKPGWDNNLACDPMAATWTSAAGANENLPISCIDWYEAYAFCIWDGGFLPSEAEWEYAAAGGAEQREYPWGNTWAGIGSSVEFEYAVSSCDYPDFDYTTCSNTPGTRNIGPVGYPYLGGGKWGQFDLAGNVYEWNLDWGNPYQSCTDCTANTQGQDDSGYIVGLSLRGGSFYSDDVEPSIRDNSGTDGPLHRFFTIGGRCARAP